MNKKCRQFQENYTLMLLSELSEDESAKTLEHLRTCESCKKEAGKISALLELVPAIEVPELDEEDWKIYQNRLNTKLSERLAAEKKPSRKPFQPGLPLWATSAAIAATAVFLILLKPWAPVSPKTLNFTQIIRQQPKNQEEAEMLAYLDVALSLAEETQAKSALTNPVIAQELSSALAQEREL